ncbi:DUF3310 domain-containing protein [Psychrobacter namhaensis]|uniref:DUF3310 domain-containing protein n=1 Tax=Psychrobacter namhaensis TaxID=292734 RepID=UPI001D108469|nr:DUF3310 domain-containing protein [Psychrobacter namhaensis]
MSEIEKKHHEEIGFPSCDINGFKWGSNERYVGGSKRSDLEKKITADMVNHPPHYKDASGIECIEVTSKMQFCGGNCFKYLYRAGKKGSTIEDLKKAAWYAEQAWQMEEITDIRLLDKIIKIAEFRGGNISDAMEYIFEDMWADAKRAIECEIQRLENMDVD